MGETMHDDVDLAVRLSRVRVRLEVLWLRADQKPDRFRELVSEASDGVLPLALLICESPVEVAEETLTDMKFEVDLEGALSAGDVGLLSRSSAWPDRCLAARSALASAEVLARLAGDESWLVRADVAENQSAPAVVLARLIGDGTWMVRLAVASNPSAPDDVVERLARDSNPSVGRAAVESLKGRREPVGLVGRRVSVLVPPTWMA